MQLAREATRATGGRGGPKIDVADTRTETRPDRERDSGMRSTLRPRNWKRDREWRGDGKFAARTMIHLFMGNIRGWESLLRALSCWKQPAFGAYIHARHTITVMLDASGVRTVDERELTNVSKSLGVSYVHVRPRS